MSCIKSEPTKLHTAHSTLVAAHTMAHNSPIRPLAPRTNTNPRLLTPHKTRPFTTNTLSQPPASPVMHLSMAHHICLQALVPMPPFSQHFSPKGLTAATHTTTSLAHHATGGTPTSTALGLSSPRPAPGAAARPSAHAGTPQTSTWHCQRPCCPTATHGEYRMTTTNGKPQCFTHHPGTSPNRHHWPLHTQSPTPHSPPHYYYRWSHRPTHTPSPKQTHLRQVHGCRLPYLLLEPPPS
eukprot:jgi/Psemu1/20584/gm1.20584_g